MSKDRDMQAANNERGLTAKKVVKYTFIAVGALALVAVCGICFAAGYREGYFDCEMDMMEYEDEGDCDTDVEELSCFDDVYYDYDVCDIIDANTVEVYYDCD